MKKSILSLSLIAVGSILACTSSMAQYTIQVGGAYVDPNSSATTAVGPLTPLGAISLQVKPQSTLFFSVAREINDKWDLQLALGLPPIHDVALKVTNAAALPASVAAQDGVIISKVTQIAPALFANYKFGEAGDALRPFVGLGVNYTKFDPADTTPANDAINGGPTKIKLSDSWGLAWQAGVVYQIDKKWSVSGTYTSADVKTTVTTNTLGIERKLDVTFDPAIFILAVGYSF
jgi:outer membrane protein